LVRASIRRLASSRQQHAALAGACAQPGADDRACSVQGLRRRWTLNARRCRNFLQFDGDLSRSNLAGRWSHGTGARSRLRPGFDLP
ncbi:hypothetical protein JKP75_18500, partial [Blastococcus sp. TML/M2B]|uniref:hypothetical protein n=1 Tax=Blastococcus sp. TML/M2B TaxID=2798727 RepID=UPI001A9177DA